MTGGLDRAGHRVDAHREVFDARFALGPLQDHPAIAVRVILRGDRRPRLAARRPHEFFHFLDRRFKLTGGERLKDDRGGAGRDDLMLAFEGDVRGRDREQPVGGRALHLAAAREDVAQAHCQAVP